MTPFTDDLRTDPDGEGPYSPVRLVVAPLPGRFVPLIPEVQPQPGDFILAGQPVGLVEMAQTETEVRSPFSGILVGMLAAEGQRVRPDQPVAWLRLHEPEAGAA